MKPDVTAMQPHVAVSDALKELEKMFSAHSIDFDDDALASLLREAGSQVRVRHQSSSLSSCSRNAVADIMLRSHHLKNSSYGCCRDCRRKQGTQAWFNMEIYTEHPDCSL